MTSSLITILNHKGYFTDSITQDKFGRFHGIIKDNCGKKYFIKAVIGQNSYSYRSLWAEAHVVTYLSVLVQKNNLISGDYRLVIPPVKEIIQKGEVLCLISQYMRGIHLVDQTSPVQADILNLTLDLVTKLSEITQRAKINQYLKNYSRKALLCYLPIHYLKAIIISPLYTLQLSLTALISLKVINFHSSTNVLIHADINSSNILVYKKSIILTDWEEAGWGVSAYNIIAPICTHWLDTEIRRILLSRFKKTEKQSEIIPLMAHRLICLFDQKLPSSDSRRIRDNSLLKYLITQL